MAEGEEIGRTGAVIRPEEWLPHARVALGEARDAARSLEGTLSTIAAGRLYSEDEEAVMLAVREVRAARRRLAEAERILS